MSWYSIIISVAAVLLALAIMNPLLFKLYLNSIKKMDIEESKKDSVPTYPLS